MITLPSFLDREFGRIARIVADYWSYRLTTVVLPLLLLPFFAPACAPNEPPPPSVPPKNIVLLTDPTQWETDELATYKDSLANAGYRVLVSGYPDESAAELTARLPWLLQPGVDCFAYDYRLAGMAGKDSLLSFLEVNSHSAQVILLGE